MSFFDELKKVTAQSLDPLGIGISGIPSKISDDYEPLIDLGEDGTKIARAIALAIAAYFTAGAAAGAGGGVTAGGTAGGATTGAGGATTGVTAGGAGAGAAPIVEAGTAITPATTAAVTPATAGETMMGAFNSLAGNELVRGAVGMLGMGALTRGGGTMPEIPRTPFQRAPQVAGVPAGGSQVYSSDQSRGTTLGGTIATSPQGLPTIAQTATPRLGTRRVLG